MQTLSRIFHIREATLVKGKLLIIDEARPDGVRSITLESVEMSLLIKAERRQADLQVSAGHAGDKGLSAMSLADDQHRRAEDVGTRRSICVADDTRIRRRIRAVNLSLRRGSLDLFGHGPSALEVEAALSRCAVTFGLCLVLRVMMWGRRSCPRTSNN